MYQVTSDKSLANEIYNYNAAGKPMMRIWEGAGQGGRIRYNQGETLTCSVGEITSDGGKQWNLYKDAPAGAPDLYFERSKMEVFTVPPPPVGEPHEIVKCTWLNGRSEPTSSTDNRVLSMRAGQVVEKIDEDGNWYKVKYNGELWMYKNYLQEV